MVLALSLSIAVTGSMVTPTPAAGVANASHCQPSSPPADGSSEVEHSTSELAQACYREGTRAMQIVDLDAAVSAFDAAVALDPNLGAAWAGRGNARWGILWFRVRVAEPFRQADSPERADALLIVRDFDTALDLGHVDAEAYLNGALLREMLDDLAGALRDAEQAARLYREQGNPSGLGNATSRVRHLQKLLQVRS